MAWYDDVLLGISAGDTANNREAMVLWAQSEGMPDSANNWLATTLGWPNATDYNSAGVKQYATYQDGVNATVSTLQESAYSAVVVAFVNDAGLQAIWQAINASPWCSGCQNGQYPVALYDAIGAPPVNIPAGTPQPQAAALAANEIAANTEWELYRSWVNADWKKVIVELWQIANAADTM